MNVLQYHSLALDPPFTRKQCGRRHQRGQALVLFALSLAVLLMLVGLTIDGLRVYIVIGQGQRAADAAALAGVEYLPSYPDAGHSDANGGNAQQRAIQEAAKNGFTNPQDIAVTVAPNTTLTLQVVIQLHISLTLTGVMNPGPASTTVTAQARMLPPIGTGDRGALFGNTTQTGLVAAIAGANELKEQGDAYTSRCEDGWTNAADTLHVNASGTPFITRLGTNTNHVQYTDGPHCSPGTPGNSDVVPAGFAGLATGKSVTPNGTSYLITVPPASTPVDVYIWNPRFTITNQLLATAPSRFNSNENVFNLWPLVDTSRYYPHIAYTVYTVPQLYNRATDVPLATLWPYMTPPALFATQPMLAWQPLPPYDAVPIDLIIHGCSLSGAWDPQARSCVSGPITGDQSWIKVPVTLAASAAVAINYRLTVDTPDGYGIHNYAIALCQRTALPPSCQSGGATVSAWNATTIQLQGNANSMSYPLATIPAEYAGRHVTISLFSPGVGTGDISLRVVPASTGTVTYPSYLRMVNTASGVAIKTSTASDSLYHGKWVRVTATLPADYTGGMWQLAWTSNGGSATSINTAMITVSITLSGSVVALLK